MTDSTVKPCPREATVAMIDAGWIATGPAPDIVPRKHYLSAMWRTMWDAAPAAVPGDAYALAQAALQAAPILGSMERAHKVVDAILKCLTDPPQ